MQVIIRDEDSDVTMADMLQEKDIINGDQGWSSCYR